MKKLAWLMLLVVAGVSPTAIHAQAPRVDASEGGAGPDGRPMISQRDLQFTLLGCRADSVAVDCTVQIETTNSNDVDILILSKQLGGVSSIGLRSLGVSNIIDPSGSQIPASSLRLANRDSDETGQSRFRIFSGIKQKLILHFDNVGVNISSIPRLTIVVLESEDNHLQSLPVVFRDVSLSRAGTAVSSAKDFGAGVDPRLIVRTADWRLIFRGCRREPEGIDCTLLATNLRDTKSALFVGWTGDGSGVRLIALERLGISTVLDDQGNTFAARGLSVKPAGYPAVPARGNGQGGWYFDPFQTTRVDAFFPGVPRDERTIARVDFAVANATGAPTPFAARFLNVPIAPMAHEADPSTDNWEAGPGPVDPEANRLCNLSASRQGMLSALSRAAHGRAVSNLSSVATIGGVHSLTSVSVSSIIGRAPTSSYLGAVGINQSRDVAYVLCDITYGNSDKTNTFANVLMNLTSVDPYRGTFVGMSTTVPSGPSRSFRFYRFIMPSGFSLPYNTDASFTLYPDSNKFSAP